MGQTSSLKTHILDRLAMEQSPEQIAGRLKLDAINLIRHNITFEMAALVFLDESRLIAQDNRFDYGEERMITMGHIDNRLHVIVYISARKAHKRERHSPL